MKVSLFALQVFLPLPVADPVRFALVDTVRAMPDTCDFARKNADYTRVSKTLMGYVGSFAFGVWDYVEEHERALAEFDQWCEGTENDAAQAPAVDPYRAGQLHMFTTLLFLMARGKAADQTICEACRMPEGTEWTKQTFAKLLRTIPQLNFATVSSDAIYVRPGASGGVTTAELGEPHYQYLRKLT